MANEKNLKPFQPGQIANPKGRGKGTLNSKTIIAKWLKVKQEVEHPVTKEKIKLTQLDIMVMKQIDKARNGSVQAFDALLDRLEGRPRQESEIKFGDAPNRDIVVSVMKRNNDGTTQSIRIGGVTQAERSLEEETEKTDE